MPTAIFKVTLIQTGEDEYAIVGDYAFRADYDPGFPPYIDDDGHLDYGEPCNLAHSVKFSSLPDGSVEEFSLEVTYDDFETDWIEHDVAIFALFEENLHTLKFRKF